jgi:hypothetical protein
MSVICPICGNPTTIKEVKLYKDDIKKAIEEKRTPFDFAIRNYNRPDNVSKAKRILGKELFDSLDEMSQLAYEHQNDVLRIRYADGHTYVIHLYYVLEVFRYIAISPDILDFLHNKKVKGKNDKIKEEILTLLALMNPLYSLNIIDKEENSESGQ